MAGKKTNSKESASLDYLSLRKKTEKDGPARLYLLWGPEEYLKQDFICLLRKMCVAEGEESFNYRRITETLPSENLIEEAVNGMPFMGEKTFVELTGFDINKCRSEKMADILKDIPEWCTVVVSLPSGVDPDGRLSLVALIKKIGEAICFTSQNGDMLARWITKRAAAYGKKITGEAIERLVFLSGELMNRLGTELEKVCSYCREDTVRVTDVEAVAHHIPEAIAFDLAEALSKKDFEKAADVLNELQAQDMEELAILGTIGWQMRQLYYASAASAGNASIHLKEILGTGSDYRVKKTLETARRFRRSTLRKYVQLCTETDYLLKSSMIAEESCLKDLLIRFALEAENV